MGQGWGFRGGGWDTMFGRLVIVVVAMVVLSGAASTQLRDSKEFTRAETETLVKKDLAARLRVAR